MAADKIIGASLQLDTGDSSAKLKEFNKGVDETQAKLSDAGKAAAKTGEDIKGTGGSFGKLKDQLTSIPGPVGQAAQGVTGLGTAFKALLANPVGLVLAAIVATVTLLYKAFTNTFEGGKKVEQVFSGIKAAGQALLDNLDKIGSAIVKVFTFDFSGAIDEIKGVAKAAGDAFSAMSKLTKQAQDLKKEGLQNDLEAAERQKKLAILRQQATDEDVPVAKRKAALKELKEAAEENAKADIDFAKRIAENKIAQLTLEKDGALKNAEEINQIKIEQIQGEVENANEIRNISKQLTGIEKQENAERVASSKAAAEQKKAQAEQLAAFTTKLTKLQQENELATIKDGYEKELKALEFRIQAERDANQKAFNDKQINRKQLDQLNAALDIQSNLAKDAIDQKYNEEKLKKEADFQKELAKISTETRLKGITDARELEKMQLQIGYEEKLQDAIARYKDDQVRFQEVKNALDEQLRVEQAAIDEKNRVEDEKKKFEQSENGANAVLNDPMASFDLKKQALDLEVIAVQEAFDAKALSEEQYNQKTKALSDARIALDSAEKESRMATFGAIGNAFSQLSDLMGKKTAIGKAFAVAAATIAAIQSAVNSFNSLSVIPIVGPALGAVAAAAAIAAGIANVKKIVSVQVPGQGGGGGSVPVPTAPAAPIAPSQGSTKLDSSTIGKLKANSDPVRAYTLESEGANASERQKRLQRAAVLGG